MPTYDDDTKISCDARDGQLDSDEISGILEDMSTNAEIYFSAAFDSSLAYFASECFPSEAGVPKVDGVSGIADFSDIAERIDKVRDASGHSVLRLGYDTQRLVGVMASDEAASDPDGQYRVRDFLAEKTGVRPSDEALSFLAAASGVVKVDDSHLEALARNILTEAAKLTYAGLFEEDPSVSEQGFVDAVLEHVKVVKTEEGGNALFRAIDYPVSVVGTGARVTINYVLSDDIKHAQACWSIVAAVNGLDKIARATASEVIADFRKEYREKRECAFRDAWAEQGIPLKDVREYKGDADWTPSDKVANAPSP